MKLRLFHTLFYIYELPFHRKSQGSQKHRIYLSVNKGNNVHIGIESFLFLSFARMKEGTMMYVYLRRDEPSSYQGYVASV